MTYKADASELSFSATDRFKWDSDAQPGDVDEALDQLAQRAHLQILEIYDAAGNQTIDGTDRTVTLGTTRTNTDTAEFTIASSVVTLTNGGLTLIEGEVSVSTIGTGDYELDIWLEVDNAEVAGTRRYAGKSDTRTTSAITSDTTLTATNDVVLVDCTNGAITITLPPASDIAGQEYDIKKIDATGNAVTVDGDGSDTIDDGLTAVLTAQYEAITIVSDGSEWWIF